MRVQGYFSSLLVALIDVSIFLFVGPLAVRIFTTDPVVIEITHSVVHWVAALHAIDSLTAMSNALIRGVGRQSFGGVAAAISFWLVGLPVAAILAFRHDWKLAGLWTGVILGLFM